LDREKSKMTKKGAAAVHRNFFCKLREPGETAVYESQSVPLAAWPNEARPAGLQSRAIRMPKLLIHSGGYLLGLSPWRHNETKKIQTEWGEVPNCTFTTDFAASGRSSGGSSEASDIAGMINVIGNQAVESIEELRIIGHSNDKVFALPGLRPRVLHRRAGNHRRFADLQGRHSQMP
jgi:hypothetical protein